MPMKNVWLQQLPYHVFHENVQSVGLYGNLTMSEIIWISVPLHYSTQEFFQNPMH